MTEFFNLLLPWWGEIDWITDSFISAIILYAVLSMLWFCWKTYRRRILIDALAETVPNDRPAKPEILSNLKAEFDRNDELAEVWQEFEDSLITRQFKENQEVVYKTDEASLFFSEDRLLGQHLNLRYWNSVPTLLVGLGILGTFIGLVWGLIPFSGVNFEQTSEIQSAIKKLLSGVSTAFVTSVWGMLASLLFNVLEKKRISRVNRAIANLQRALDRLFTLTTQEEIAIRHQYELEQLTAAFKSSWTDFASAIGLQLIPRLDNLETAVTTSAADIKSTIAQKAQVILGQLQNAPEAFSIAIARQLEPSFNNLETAVTTSVADIKSSIAQEAQVRQEILGQLQNAPEAFSIATARQLEPSFNNLKEVLQQQSNNLDNLHQSLKEWHDQNTREGQEILELLRSAPEDFSNAMATQLAPSLDKLNEAIEELREQKEASSTDTIRQLVEEFQKSLSGSITAQMETLGERVDKVSESLITLPNQMKNMMDEMLNTFQSAIEIQQLGLVETTESVNEETKRVAASIQNLLKSAANQADDQLAQRMADIKKVSNQSIQTLQETITELQKSITSTASQAATEFATTTDLMRELFQDVEQSVGTLLQQQDEQIEAINVQLDNSQATLTRGREMLEQMNASITSVSQLIETTKALSGDLTTGADQLKSAGKQLAQASNAFNQENEKYLTANRETTKQIQNALGVSQQLLKDFQTINNELKGIFTQIEQGLNTYATISRESINTYLKEFSDQLTQASVSLASSIEALHKTVEELTEML